MTSDCFTIELLDAEIKVLTVVVSILLGYMGYERGLDIVGCGLMVVCSYILR